MSKGMKASKRPKAWSRPRTSRAIPRKADSGSSCKLAPPKSLIQNGEWAVPPEQRPPGWELMVLSKPAKPIEKRKPAPKQETRPERKERPKVVVQERHGGFYPFPTPVTKNGRLDKAKLASLMRQHPTKAESRLWNALLKWGLKGKAAPRLQVLMLGWIVDIYFPKAKLVVEVDGSVHDNPEQAAYDKHRDEVFRKNKFRVLRFSNSQVFDDLEGTLARIKARIDPPKQLPDLCTVMAGGSQGKPSSTKLGVRSGELARSQKSEGRPLSQQEAGQGNAINGVAPVRKVSAAA